MVYNTFQKIVLISLLILGPIPAYAGIWENAVSSLQKGIPIYWAQERLATSIMLDEKKAREESVLRRKLAQTLGENNNQKFHMQVKRKFCFKKIYTVIPEGGPTPCLPLNFLATWKFMPIDIVRLAGAVLARSFKYGPLVRPYGFT